MSDAIVVGLDIGGTSTRATVVSTTGERLGTGLAGGGNPTSHGADKAADELHRALTQALPRIDPGLVRAGAIGLAGAGRLLADPAGRAAFDRAWQAAGLRCPYAIFGDALVAYASATAATDGTILVAGTGAIAAQVRDLSLDHIADGHGWLLGDAGSGFWLGREAVRHTLAGLDRRQPPTTLGALVLSELLGSPHVAANPRETVNEVVQAVTRRPPVELAALAPLIVRADQDGDRSATVIITEAARLLAASVGRIRPPASTTPVVIGGGLLTGKTPLAEAVRTELGATWPDAPLLSAGDGAAAAAWLAARTLPGVDPVRLHRRLLP